MDDYKRILFHQTENIWDAFVGTIEFRKSEETNTRRPVNTSMYTSYNLKISASTIITIHLEDQ
jgi:hypothetical protein